MELPGNTCERRFRELLLKYQELDLTDNRELSVNFSSLSQLTDQLESHPIYENLLSGRSDKIPVVYVENFTGQVPAEIFEKRLDHKFAGKTISEEERERLHVRRMQEGITIIEEGKKPILLCDSPASLMSQLYPLRICIMREYQYEDVPV